MWFLLIKGAEEEWQQRWRQKICAKTLAFLLRSKNVVAWASERDLKTNPMKNPRCSLRMTELRNGRAWLILQPKFRIKTRKDWTDRAWQEDWVSNPNNKSTQDCALRLRSKMPFPDSGFGIVGKRRNREIREGKSDQAWFFLFALPSSNWWCKVGLWRDVVADSIRAWMCLYWIRWTVVIRQEGNSSLFLSLLFIYLWIKVPKWFRKWKHKVIIWIRPQ